MEEEEAAVPGPFPPPADGFGMPVLLEDEDKLEMERGSCEDDMAAARGGLSPFASVNLQEKSNMNVTNIHWFINFS